MYFLCYLIGFPIGWALFKFLNNNFDIYYFGIAGLVGTFSGCMTAGAIAVGVVFILLQSLAIPALVIIFVLLLIGRFSQKKKSKQ